jgi:glycosyltransferase involved in cell wall biosynthesis
MKILVVSHQLPPKYRAGAELYALRQAMWLQAKGHTVRAVAVEDIEASVPQLEVRHEEYLGLEVERLHFNRLAYPNVLEASHLNPEITAWMEQFLREYQPDLMLVNACYLLGVGVLHAARQLNIPVVLTLHDFWFLCQRITLMRPDGTLCDGKVSPADCALCISKDKRRYLLADKFTGGLFGRGLVAGAEAGLEPFMALLGGKQKIQTLALRRERLLEALKGVECVIAPSRYLRQLFIENGFPAEKIRYCRYGLDTGRLAGIEQQKLAPETKAQPAETASRGLRVGYMGQVLPHKGVDVLVEAFRQLDNPEARLSIHGVMGRDPAYDLRLQQLATGDSRIRFAGPYMPEELPAILLGLDVVVVPSIWLENSPLIIMEAQAAGLPVITTNLGGMAEMVRHDQDGLLFERKNVSDLAAQLRRLQNEPGLLAHLKAGVAPVKSLDEEFSELLPLYEDLATRHIPSSL